MFLLNNKIIIIIVEINNINNRLKIRSYSLSHRVLMGSRRMQVENQWNGEGYDDSWYERPRGRI